MKNAIHPLLATLALVALVFSLMACGAPQPTTLLRAARAESPTEQATTTQPAATQAAPGTTPAQPTGAVLGMLEIHSVDLGFNPPNLKVAQPGRYTIKFTNDGAIPHDVTFPDGTKLAANAKETKTAEIEVPASGLSFICSVPGHADAGMTGAISVARNTAIEHNADDHGGPPPTTDVQPDDKAPAPRLYDASAPAALAGTTHDIDLVVEENNMTVAKDFVQAVWTFNGTVPGPV